ncbi:hypothetical protein KSS87_009458 [Heliosperma pusillum]|nr:hypothetical protein KSS87_004362 [Heliosperma pusillum]KAH9615272.1 hypothetical protein KSS87_009458 [Heliosperma pusillum]
MADVSIAPRIDRTSSIETEPRTLNFRQIDIARAAALYVVHTRTREEACQIFTEGLEEVETIGSQKMGNLWEYLDEEEDEYSFGRRAIMKARHNMKDVLTAPF